MKNSLSKHEISIIKGILEYYPNMLNQEILSKFSIPSRTINSGRIAEIKQGHKRYTSTPPATKDKVDDFINGKITLNELISGGLYFSEEHNSVINRTESVFENIDVDIREELICQHESHDIEYKENYEKESVPAYAKILAGMVNARVYGSIIFGVSDDRKIIGTKSYVGNISKELQAFLFRRFEPYIKVEATLSTVFGKKIVQVKVLDIPDLPVICKKTKTIRENAIVREGEIYYRYGESVERIKFPELISIIRGCSKE